MSLSSSRYSHDLPSFTNEKFAAATEQSKILPLPTKQLLERVRALLLSRIPFTAGGCRQELQVLKELAAEIVDSHMFDASPGLQPLQLHLRDSRESKESAVFDAKFSKWKEGRKNVKVIKSALAELIKPFAKYSVEWEESRRGRAHQFGLRSNVDGSYYQGEWDSSTGLRHGVGVQVEADGTLYEGAFEDEKKTGDNCSILFPDGRRLDGSVADGAPHGTATMYYTTGDRYSGNWVKGTRQGQGTFYSADGTLYQGNWVKDGRSGQGTLYNLDGTTFVGSFEADKRSGAGELYLPGSAVVSGIWRSDHLHSVDSVTLGCGGAVCTGPSLKVTEPGFNLTGTGITVFWSASGIKAVCALQEGNFVRGVTYKTSRGTSGTIHEDVLRDELAAATGASDSAHRLPGWWAPLLKNLIQRDVEAMTQQAPTQARETHQQKSKVATFTQARPAYVDPNDDISRYGAHAYHVRGK